MYLCLSIAIERLLAVKDLSTQNAFATTGPGVLDMARKMFTGSSSADMVQGNYSIDPDLVHRLQEKFPGDDWMTNRNLQVVGSAQNPDEFVKTSAIRGKAKMHFYELVGMSVWQNTAAHTSNLSCQDWLLLQAESG
mmetsp:Transcript_53004/g.146808  ORF Transcript_53004/g.146808 Transcript_53004/m.146808 type:complete len:136 (+) Transcript_53004:2-409(+)